jgi:hypothetical protein
MHIVLMSLESAKMKKIVLRGVWQRGLAYRGLDFVPWGHCIKVGGV